MFKKNRLKKYLVSANRSSDDGKEWGFFNFYHTTDLPMTESHVRQLHRDIEKQTGFDSVVVLSIVEIKMTKEERKNV